MRMALILAFAGIAVLSLATGWLALADQTKVAGTPHDLAATASPGTSACEVCHVPHEAAGQPLWAGEPRTDEAFTGLAPGCYSCHDGTVASGAYTFDASRVQHAVKVGEPGKDCDMCHDAHLSDYGEFLKFPSGPNLCQVCHGHEHGLEHPLNISPYEAGYHPIDTVFDPDNGDFSGTRLWPAAGAAGPADQLKCLTCHVSHGAAQDTGLLAMGYKEMPGEVAPGEASSLCQNCHH